APARTVRGSSCLSAVLLVWRRRADGEGGDLSADRFRLLLERPLGRDDAAVSELALADGGETRAAHRGERVRTWRVSRVGHGRLSLDFLLRGRAGEKLRRRTRRRGSAWGGGTR